MEEIKVNSPASPSAYQLHVNGEKVSIQENPEQSDYLRNNVCLPYFREIYKDLSKRSLEKEKGISKVTFFDYIELPGIIAERLFAIFDENNDVFIDLNEFVSGMFKIYVSDMNTKLRLVFDIYDFDKDGSVTKDEIKTVLCYVPINKILEGKLIRKEGKFTQEGGGNEVYLDRVKSQEEIENLLQFCFGEKEKISFEEFVRINQESSSDLLITVINFLTEKLPCSENFWRYEKGIKKLDEANTPKKSELLTSPNRLSKFSPLSLLVPGSDIASKRRLSHCQSDSNSLLRFAVANQSLEKCRANSICDEPNPFTTTTDPGVDQKATTSSIPMSGFKSNLTSKQNQDKKSKFAAECDSPLLSPRLAVAVRMPNVTNIEKKFGATLTIDGKPTAITTDLIKNTEEIQSPSTFLAEKTEKAERLSRSSSEDSKEVVMFDGELMKKTEENTFEKYWFCLENKELFYYENKDDAKHKGMYSLIGVFVKEDDDEFSTEKSTLYPFQLIFPHKIRTYYADSQANRDEWVLSIKKAVGYANLYDFYDMAEKLGRGKFGLVRAAIHKKTGKKVAVKIIKKEEIPDDELELLKREIEILKICQHPNIIRLLDIFENLEYIYIVMELLKGGDLFTYIENRKFSISEERARSITHSIATSTFYLHSYGITHRDLKPENILVVDKSEVSDIKLVDFGLSKIIGPNETCNEPFGTLSYVAPEVLLQQPYGKAVDLWSIGVITYLLLSGSLPFDDPEDSEVARQTIYDTPDFTEPVWDKVSKKAKNFVERLLVKEPENRMTLEQVLEHPWLVKGAVHIRDLRRNSLNDRLSKFKVFSHSQPDSPRILEEIERRAEEDDVGGF